jgi:hypothetical protein
VASSELETALQAFDQTDANIRRLEAVWKEMLSLVPDGIAFVGGSAEDHRYRDLDWAFDQIATALPPVHGFTVTARPLGLNEIAQARLDAADIGEVSLEVQLWEEVNRPGVEIHDYRTRFDRARRELVRRRVSVVVDDMDRLLADLAARYPRDMNVVEDPAVDGVDASLSEIERLSGALVPRDDAGWSNMRRHIRFRQGQDIQDIAQKDWPAVRAALQANLYSELEPIPAPRSDLGELSVARPGGPATSQLEWESLTPEDFERLLFNILIDAPEYQNVRWVTHTNAPDRGRDISAERVLADSLSGIRTQRVIVQAKHWLTKSVTVDDVAEAHAQMYLWEPPTVHVLVVATSGRLTTDALDWVEKHENDNRQPRIEVWTQADLELILARRPHVAATARLRRQSAQT